MIRTVAQARFEEIEGGSSPAWMRYQLVGQITTRSGGIPVNVTVCSADCGGTAIRDQLIEVAKQALKGGLAL